MLREDAIREKWLAFEREQWKKGLRPRLPCDVRKDDELSYSEKQAKARSIEKKDRRVDVYNSLLDVIGDKEIVSAREIGERTGYPTQTVANFLRFMVKENYVVAIPRTDDHGSSWAYAKTGRKPS